MTEPQRKVDEPDHGWSAKDVDPDEYSDDDYAAQFPVVS